MVRDREKLTVLLHFCFVREIIQRVLKIRVFLYDIESVMGTNKTPNLFIIRSFVLEIYPSLTKSETYLSNNWEEEIGCFPITLGLINFAFLGAGHLQSNPWGGVQLRG